MAREIIHKKLKVGTLVQIINTGEFGIIIHSLFNLGSHVEDPYCYGVLVKGKKVRAYQGGFTIIGEF